MLQTKMCITDIFHDQNTFSSFRRCSTEHWWETVWSQGSGVENTKDSIEVMEEEKRGERKKKNEKKNNTICTQEVLLKEMEETYGAEPRIAEESGSF